LARHQAIAATSNALLGLLRDRYSRDDFGTSLEIQLYQSRDFEAPMREGFSVFLYRVTINGTVRNMTLRRAPDGRRFRPSLPLDLHYVITPWAEDGERQQRMLGWVMRFMEDLGVLTAGHLNHYVTETNVFAPHEGLEIICDPLALADYLTLWDRLRPRMPTSATYALRMLSIDSDVRIDDGALVQTRRFDMGQAVT
jgi:Pvc16 N-terminal domain